MTDTTTDADIITEITEVVDGDWIVAEFDGHRFEGEAWLDEDRDVKVGGWLVTAYGRMGSGITFIEARRSKPDLPVTPSLIRARVDGESVVLFGPDSDDDWFHPTAPSRYIAPSQVESFEILWAEDVE